MGHPVAFGRCRRIGGGVHGPTRAIGTWYPGGGPWSAGIPLLVEIPAKGARWAKMKWRLLLPGASEPRLAELNPLGLQTWSFKLRYAA